MTETLEKSFLARCIELGYFDIIRSNHLRRIKAILAANITDRQQRREKFQEHRRNNVWADYLAKSRTVNGYFMKRYKMSENAFNRLVDILDLRVDETKSKNSTGGIEMICPQIIVAAGLRWLGGDDMKSIEDTFHISLSSAQRIVNRFLQAVVDCDHQDCVIELPPDDQLEAIAQEWSKLSTAGGSMFGCVLAVDGFLSPRLQPNVESSRDYYTDRKSIYCLNIIAAVDHLGRFRFFAVAAPGGTNDVRAYWRCHVLKEWIDRLKDISDGRYYVTADNAFPWSNELLIPFRRSQLNGDRYKDSYNYYLSQLRIRIEMAFGRLSGKFGLLRQKMKCSLETQSMALQAAAKLHNFIINTDGVPTGQALQLNANNQLDPAQVATNGIVPLPDGMGPNGFIAVDFDAKEAGSSSHRDTIVTDLTHKERILRPDAPLATED